MTTRLQVVQQARTWIGTPYDHQGREKGVRVDCAGLILEVCRELHLTDLEHTQYGRFPDGNMDLLCDKYMDRIQPVHAEAGDILLFAFEHWNAHMAFLTERDTMIHAWMRSRKVVEHTVDKKWRSQIQAAYHIPGVEW